MAIRIYDRYDNDIPYTSDIYIVDAHDVFVVFENIYGVTFSNEFKNKSEALEYYLKSKNKGGFLQ